MKNRFKLFSAAIAVLITLAVLSSLIIAGTAHNHHCTGEDCPVCQAVTLCKRLADIFCSELYLVCLVSACLFGLFVSGTLPCFKPVALKNVKLLN